MRHSLKWTHVSPISRHSLQPLPLGLTWRISFTWGQVACSSGMCRLQNECCSSDVIGTDCHASRQTCTGEDARACITGLVLQEIFLLLTQPCNRFQPP